MGRHTIINSVLSALPKYQMSACLSPVVLNQLDAHRRYFLWAREKEQRKCHYFIWDIAQTSKGEGGLGIKRLDIQNAALLFWGDIKCLLPLSEGRCKSFDDDQGVDTGLHIFGDCDLALWFGLSLTQLIHNGESEFWAWVIQCLKQIMKLNSSPGTQKTLPLFLATCWCLWKERNERRFSRKQTHITKILQTCTIMAEDIAWAPPPPRWIKVNSDGAVKSMAKGRATAVFWDSGGDLLWAP